MDPETRLLKVADISNNPKDANYIDDYQYMLLLEIVDFLTPENIQKYFVDFYIKRQPCCKRTVYFYLTRIISDPKYTHLSHYTYNNTIIRVNEWYQRCLKSDGRKNNDVFGRGNQFQVKLDSKTWIPITLVQSTFAYFIHQIRLLEHIHTHLDEIIMIMKRNPKPSKEKELPFYMC